MIPYLKGTIEREKADYQQAERIADKKAAEQQELFG